MADEKIVNPEAEELEAEESVVDGDIVELVDEEGKAVPFVFQGTVDYEEEVYAFFSPLEDQEDLSTDEVVIFRLSQDADGEDLFLPVEDEALLDAVFNAFIESADEYEECDCDGECECDGDCDCDHDHDCDCDHDHDCHCGCHHDDDKE